MCLNFVAVVASLALCLTQSSFGADVPTGSFLMYHDLGGKPYTVSADERSWIVNGQRTLLLGGSIHYPRFSPGQWRDVLTKMKDDGLNHAEVYVFWNIHEPKYLVGSNQHTYNYEGRANLTSFLQIATEVGMFVDLRIGPYVCAEWSFGGLPTWLLHVPGISFRDSNQPWENAMQTFVEEIARVSQPYLAQNGGPIILAQIENEYHGSQAYVNWCGQLTTQLNMNVSWVMCNGESASNTINTCNGNNCYGYAQAHGKNYPGEPLGWTENEGWFEYWSKEYNPNSVEWDNRSPQEMAYTVALWMGAGGAHHNYYMWCGGNHVSHWAGSGIANYYADGVNYHADGLPHEPKRSHLQRLHNVLGEHQKALLGDSIQVGHEVPLPPAGDNGTYSLSWAGCDANAKAQQFSYDSGSKLLQATGISGGTHCAVATGKSDPVQTATCDASNTKQHWTFTGQEFQSTLKSCLDVFGGSGPNIDEWACKSPSSSDAKNQQWTISGSQIKSNLNSKMCLSASVTAGTFAYVYQGQYPDERLVFLCNTEGTNASVQFDGMDYFLPAASVAIIDNEGTELFNSFYVNSKGLPTQRVYENIYSAKDLHYASWAEMFPLNNNPQKRPDWPTTSSPPLEQIRFTNDSSEYVFYSTNFTLASSQSSLTLAVMGREANAYMAFVDAAYAGQGWNGAHSAGNLAYNIKLSGAVTAGPHTLTVVSSSLGISNGIANQKGASAQDMKGIVGYVRLMSGSATVLDVTHNQWHQWIGETGEVLDVAGSGAANVQWTTPAKTTQAMTWYQTTFKSPSANAMSSGVILVDIGDSTKSNASASGMNRGHFWLNGMDMGHYNNVVVSGYMTQRYYFIPKDYLASDGGSNTLLFAEELPNPVLTNVNIVFSTVVIPQ